MRRSYPFIGKLLRVRVDQLDAGGKTVTCEVVEHPGSAAVIALTADDQVILVRQRRHAIDADILEIPAGLVDPGEEPVDTAKRELLEETGFEPEDLWPVCTMVPSPGYSNERIALFCATGCKQAGQIAEEADSIRLNLVNQAAIPGFFDDSTDEIVDAKTFAALSWLAAHWPVERHP
jgi:ADP-ribose pyrophosphatase